MQPDKARASVQDKSGELPDLATASKVYPLDSHNVALLDKVRRTRVAANVSVTRHSHSHLPKSSPLQVHPAIYNSPSPKANYDLVVIGAGAGGLVSAAGAAGVGAKVALIEEHLLGGDCLNVGCVPSKALIRAARAAAELRRAQTDADGLGITLQGSVQVDFPKVMERMRRLRAEIAENDSVERFTTKLGVDVFLGTAKFTSPSSVVVNGQQLVFSKCVIATGGSPLLPKIPGLHDLYASQSAESPRILTNVNLFNLTSLPRRFGVIGGGVVGCEMAQTFARSGQWWGVLFCALALRLRGWNIDGTQLSPSPLCRFGSQVHVFGRSGRILPKEDADVAQIVQTRMQKDGVDFQLNVKEYTSVEARGDVVVLKCELNSGTHAEFELDALLVAAGRRPNVA